MAAKAATRTAAPPRPPTLWLARPAAFDGLPPRRAGADRAMRTELFRYLESRQLGPAAGPGLSHAGGWAAYVAQEPGPTGLDLEWVRPRDVGALARFAYAPAEADALDERPPAARDEAFVALWVLKEAAAKALGLDLFTALARCEFRIDGARIEARLTSSVAWQAWLYAPRPQLRLACVTLQRAPAAPLAPAGLEWTPGAALPVTAAWPLVAAGASAPD